MNKSLAQRISDHTHRVTVMRQNEKARKNKEAVLKFLEKTVHEAANEGKELFCDGYGNQQNCEFTVTVGNVRDAVGLTSEDTIKALEDLGFKINNYNMCRMFATTQNLSTDVQKLLNEYDQMVVAYENREKELAETDYKQVIKLLEDGEYEVRTEDAITVKFESKSDTEIYLSIVEQKMFEEGFDVRIDPNKWFISVIQEKGE